MRTRNESSNPLFEIAKSCTARRSGVLPMPRRPRFHQRESKTRSHEASSPCASKQQRTSCGLLDDSLALSCVSRTRAQSSPLLYGVCRLVTNARASGNTFFFFGAMTAAKCAVSKPNERAQTTQEIAMRLRFLYLQPGGIIHRISLRLTPVAGFTKVNQ